MKTTTVEMPIRTFVEKAGVTCLETQFVSGEPTDGTVKPAVAGKVLGIMRNRLYVGQKDVAILIFGQTARVTQEAAIPVFSDVTQGTTPGKAKAAVAGGRILGCKIQPASDGAAGDIIEIVLAGTGANGGATTLTTVTGVLHGNANGAIAGLSSTAVNPTKADFDGLLAATEVLADDVRSLRAALISAGIPIVEA